MSRICLKQKTVLCIICVSGFSLLFILMNGNKFLGSQNQLQNWVKYHKDTTTKPEAKGLMDDSFRKESTKPDEISPQLNVLLIASYRSGSSFTGELLKQNKKMLYLYEPFKVFMSTNYTVDSEILQKNIRSYIPALFDCRYEEFWMTAKGMFPNDTDGRMFWYKKVFMQLIARHGLLEIQEMERVCRSYAMRTMKIIRNDYLENLVPLINNSAEQYAGNGLKILYLVRDPRGVAISQHSLRASKQYNQPFLVYMEEEKNVHNIIDTAKQVCSHYATNLDYLQSMDATYQSKLQSHLAFIRYEDLAYHPLYYTDSIYRFLNTSVPVEVLAWVKQSTALNNTLNSDTHPYKTVRNSSSTVENWRNLLHYFIARRIDKECGDILTRLGYSPVTSFALYRNATISLVNKLPDDIPCGVH